VKLLVSRLSSIVLTMASLYAVLLLPFTRPGPGFQPAIDGWLNGFVRFGIVAVLFVRSQVDRRERAAWLCLCGGQAISLAASITYFVHYRHVEQPSAVTWADIGWLAFYPLLYVGLVLLLRARVPRMIPSLWLDGLVAGLTAATLAAAFFAGGDGPFAGARSVGLISFYPIADLILVGLSVAATAILGNATDRVWWLLCGSFVMFAVADAVYAAAVIDNSYVPGTLDLGWLIARLGLLAAAWVSVRPYTRRRPAEFEGLRVLAVPVVSLFVILGLLFYGTTAELPVLAASLALAAGGAVVVRTLMTFREVGDLVEARRQARTDDLTGLPNRRAFTEGVHRALQRRSPRKPLAVLVLNVDSFKGVNDTLGYDRGDELLELLASRLQLVKRPQDMVARIGGDEFGMLLDDADAPTAEAVAERLRLACRGPFTIATRTVTLGASVGIGVFPQDGDAVALMQHADNAMSAAKEHRLGQSFFRPDYHQASRARLDGVEEMRDAIASHQFILHYQPKVSLSDGKVVGVEALVRWQHPSQGLLGPHMFLPQLERGGLMQDLTVSVLDQALAQWSAWNRQGTSISVAVNLSVSDLLNPSLPEQVARALARHGAGDGALILELTEDLLLSDRSRGREVIDTLSSQGVRVQIDDYGTGFSTLGYLRDLPTLHGLKLDRSFTEGIASEARSVAIVASTVALAADLGLELVAEGVEDEATSAKLTALGCPQAQGYFFGRPVPAAEVSF
jgi:diguanylate cyclase